MPLFNLRKSAERIQAEQAVIFFNNLRADQIETINKAAVALVNVNSFGVTHQTKRKLMDYVKGNAAYQYYNHDNISQVINSGIGSDGFWRRLGNAIKARVKVSPYNKNLSRAKLMQMYDFAQAVTGATYTQSSGDTHITVSGGYTQQGMLNKLERVRKAHKGHIYNSYAHVETVKRKAGAESVFEKKPTLFSRLRSNQYVEAPKVSATVTGQMHFTFQ